MLEGIRTAPVPVPHRLAIRNHFDHLGFDKGIGAWMTTNLRHSPDGYIWAMDLPVIESMLTDYRDLDLWSFIDDAHRRIDLHFLLAGQTTWWNGAVRDRLNSAHQTQSYVLPKAGHWVHIDDPDGMLAAFLTTFETVG